MGYQTQDKSKLNTSLGFDFDLNKFVKGLSTKVLLAYDVLEIEERVVGEFVWRFGISSSDEAYNCLFRAYG